MPEPGAYGRFVFLDSDSAGLHSIVRAFLWLKRRCEESSGTGLLALPDEPFLAGPLAEALGWRLTEVLREEGELPLGGGISLRWTTLDSLFVSSPAPLAAIHPRYGHLGLLRDWSGPVLVVPASSVIAAVWASMTGAAEPAPENYRAEPSPLRPGASH